jgi:hypothetical protein
MTTIGPAQQARGRSGRSGCPVAACCPVNPEGEQVTG